MRRPLVRVGFDCVAQPTIKQAAAPASVRLRHLRICNRALNSSPRSEGQGIIYKNSLGLLDLGDSFGSVILPAETNLVGYGASAWPACESSLVQWGQRVALIGIVIAQAGHSFETGAAVGVGRFILFTPLTMMKIAKATIRKFINSVMKLP